MIYAKEDNEYLRTKPVRDAQKEYWNKFGEIIYFNYIDFHPKDGKRAVEIYKETLEQCVRENKPFRTEKPWWTGEARCHDPIFEE